MDYRLTQYDSFNFSTLQNSKKNISNLIDTRVRNKIKKGEHYEKIYIKNGSYYTLFVNAYDSKCAYCGITTDIISTGLFEIDHFINKTQKFLSSGISVNNVENLVFSCRNCNQAKHDYDTSAIYELIHPDNDSITNIFVRSDTYGIYVREEYRDNTLITGFYKKLHLDSSFRKLDYLLMNLKAMSKIDTKCELNHLILRLYTDLLEKRNRYI
ncbi:HNH endonuclease [Lactococcus lactis]|uniref:HNH endonuclease n=1 Tax=Lactococcus lactis TaxID=1358 RepID=UPI00223BB432|nr:HNH endonuclease signature motif containing protein [Lactococcus lactis]MCT0077375.1 HNH endonuclease [Lactococcus lactis subsp. lactis]